MKRFRDQENDDDVHGYTFTSDNVGHGKYIRYETTTRHVQTLRFSSLPPSVQEFAKEEAEKGGWVSMEKSGIESSEDLVASPESDDIQRMMVILACTLHHSIINVTFISYNPKSPFVRCFSLGDYACKGN